MRISRSMTFAIIALMPHCVTATVYSIGTLDDWQPRIQSAMRYVEVEYNEGVDSMPADEKFEAIYLIAYLDGIRDGSWYNGAIAYSKKYGNNSAYDPNKEVDSGFCMDDPYFEIVPKLDKHIAENGYADDTDFIDVLMNFLATEYSCE